MNATQIKEIDSKCLKDYLYSLPSSDRRFFVTKVVENCGVGITKKTFYNWTAGSCCIPDFCKKEIEKAAGFTVFPKELYYTESSQSAES